MALLVEPARPVAIREHPSAPWFAVGTVCFGAFMGQLDASIVTLAFPSLQREFHTRLAAVQWVSLAYLLVLIALLVPVGRLSDRFGRKLVYLAGFLVFTAASIGCALAGSLPVLVGLRLAQALGAAMLQANSVALVVTSVPEPQRRAALGIQAAAQAFGLAIGPLLGGLLVASLGWRWIFLVNAPVGFLAIAAGWFLLPRTRHRTTGTRLDIIGVLLLAGSVISLLVTVSAVSGLRLPLVALATLVVVAITGGAVLRWWEPRVPDPLLDPSLLERRPMGPALAGALLGYLVLFGPLVLYPQTLTAHGGAALRTGLLLTALPAGFGLAAALAERIIPTGWSNRRRCTAGALVAAIASGIQTIPALPGPALAGLLLLAGAGLGVFIPANNAIVMGSLPEDRAATGGGMVNMARGLGTALGVAAVTLTLHVTGNTRAGGTWAMSVIAVLALAAAGTGLINPTTGSTGPTTASTAPTADRTALTTGPAAPTTSSTGPGARTGSEPADATPAPGHDDVRQHARMDR